MYQTGKLITLCTARLLAETATIIQLTINDPHSGTKRLVDDFEYTKRMAIHLYEKASALSVRDYARESAAFAVESLATGKVLAGLSAYTKKAHQAARAAVGDKIKVWCGNIPTTVPGYLCIDFIPGSFDAFCKATTAAHGNTKKVAQSLRREVSKAREYIHCQGIKRRFESELPQLAAKYGPLLNASADDLSHVIFGKIERWGLNGCHTYYGLKGLGLPWKWKRSLAGEIDELFVWSSGKQSNKTMFPKSWGPDKVIKSIANAKKNTHETTKLPKQNRIKNIGVVDQNIFIAIIEEANGKFVTAYPVQGKKKWKA